MDYGRLLPRVDDRPSVLDGGRVGRGRPITGAHGQGRPLVGQAALPQDQGEGEETDHLQEKGKRHRGLAGKQGSASQLRLGRDRERRHVARLEREGKAKCLEDNGDIYYVHIMYILLLQLSDTGTDCRKV